MYHRDQHVHFIGIGGVGMAGIAEVLLNLGYSVGGSDLKSTPLTNHLVSLGASINFSHDATNLKPNTSVVVVSSAVNEANTEVIEARKRGIPIIPRAAMLSELMRMKYGIAVAGSHGKTSTTSMIGHILKECGLDPTVIVGGRILSGLSGAKIGAGQYLVAEADESDGSFCLLRPAISIITNIDAEHLSFYGSMGKLEDTFLEFAKAVPFYGLCAICVDDPLLRNLANKLDRRVVKYGFSPDAEFSATEVEISRGSSTYTLIRNGEKIGRVHLPLPGNHFVLNSLAVLAVAYELRIPLNQACSALTSFPGVSRRSEQLYRDRDYLVLDDYGHHPTEINATLKAVRESWLGQGYNRVLAIFQPHRYSRTRELFTEFLSCFSCADEVIITDVYAAGEQVIEGISGELLAQAINHPKVSYVASQPDFVSEVLGKYIQPGDVVITLGAGSITHTGHTLAANIGEKRVLALGKN